MGSRLQFLDHALRDRKKLGSFSGILPSLPSLSSDISLTGFLPPLTIGNPPLATDGDSSEDSEEGDAF